jgi:hypothetical protein
VPTAKSTKYFDLFARRNPGTVRVSVRLSSRRSHRKFKRQSDCSQMRDCQTRNCRIWVYRTFIVTIHLALFYLSSQHFRYIYLNEYVS